MQAAMNGVPFISFLQRDQSSAQSQGNPKTASAIGPAEESLSCQFELDHQILQWLSDSITRHMEKNTHLRSHLFWILAQSQSNFTQQIWPPHSKAPRAWCDLVWARRSYGLVWWKGFWEFLLNSHDIYHRIVQKMLFHTPRLFFRKHIFVLWYSASMLSKNLLQFKYISSWVTYET